MTCVRRFIFLSKTRLVGRATESCLREGSKIRIVVAKSVREVDQGEGPMEASVPHGRQLHDIGQGPQNGRETRDFETHHFRFFAPKMEIWTHVVIRPK